MFECLLLVKCEWYGRFLLFPGFLLGEYQLEIAGGGKPIFVTSVPVWAVNNFG